MRTTIEIPDTLFRRAKATAAVRGTSLKDLIVEAVGKEISRPAAAPATRCVKLPLVRLSPGRTLDLAGFNFDDLLS